MSPQPRISTSYPGVMFRGSPQGRRYIIFFSDANGAKRSKTLPLGTTLEEARAERGKIAYRKSQGESLIPTKKTVGELLDDWLSLRRPQLAPKTVELYTWAIEKHLKPAFGRQRVAAVSASDIARMIARLKGEGKKTWTVRKILVPLSGAYQIAVREGWVATSPMVKLLPHERPKADQRQMRCVPKEEIERLLESASSQRWRALFSVLCLSGLRISEALALTWEDVTEASLIVRKSKTKAGEREVLLLPSVRRLLMALRLEQPPGTNFVFATAQGGPCERRDALRALRAAEKRAGLPKYTLHELRHTFASILIAQGELPTLVAKQMGHASPEITMRTYAHLWEEQESTEQARGRLEAAMGGMV